MKRKHSSLFFLAFFLIVFCCTFFLAACGKNNSKLKVSEGLSFMTNLDGTCFVLGIGTCTDTVLVIPEISPDGDVVTCIGESAFENCSFIRNVIIPDTVKTIEKNAFKGCVWLKSITMKKSVSQIKESAFSGCKELVSVYYTGALEEWCKICFTGTTSNPLWYAHNLYINNELISSLVIPSSVKGINWYAFSGCTGLTSISFGNSVSWVGDSAFQECNELSSVYYSGSIDEWCEIEFSGFYSNPLSYAQTLYINNELIVDLRIPNGVANINNWAFDGCASLKTVIIPEGVTTIGKFAFSHCSGLTHITLPVSLSEIGVRAFEGCAALKSITFQGTKAQWYGITKNMAWDDYSKSLVIHCIDGDI